EVVAGDLLARQLLRPGNRGQQRQAACQGTNIATKRREDSGQAAYLRRIIVPARSRANAGYVSKASVAYQRSRAAASALALARVCSSGASRSRRRCTRSGPAFSGEPESNGGCGSYSSTSWIDLATSSPASSAATVRPKSMPAVTP